MAIAEAVAERLQGRTGNPELRANSGNISLIDKGQTRDLAAAKAGLGSGKAPALPVLLCDLQRGL